jgi:hypothetical protein
MNLAASNRSDALERPRSVAAVPRGYSAAEVRRLLAVLPDTVPGRRDRALLLTFVLTGRRRAEVLSLTAGDLACLPAPHRRVPAICLSRAFASTERRTTTSILVSLASSLAFASPRVGSRSRIG